MADTFLLKKRIDEAESEHKGFLGGIVASMTYTARYSAVWRVYSEILRARPPTPPEVWGDDKDRALAELIRKAVVDNLDWPNDHFLPQDEVGAVFWTDSDDLVVLEAYWDIERALGIPSASQSFFGIHYSEWEPIRAMSLADFIKFLRGISSEDS